MARYLKTFAVTVVLGLGSIVGLNGLIDPFDAFGAIRIPGFNANKPRVIDHLKLMKAYAVRRIRPRGIVLGTSRADVGIDPNHPGWNPAARPRYNLSLDGANMYEIWRYFQHARRVAPLRQVVIGLDFAAFNALKANTADFDEEILARGNHLDFPALLLRTLSLLASRDMLLASLHTILNPSEPSWQGPDGRASGEYYELHVKALGGHRNAFTQKEKYYLSRRIAEKGDDQTVVHALRSPAGTTMFTPFRELVREARWKNIDLRLFISPTHARHLETVCRWGPWAEYEQWKRELVAILAEDHLRHPKRRAFPLWDFSGYNSVTTEAVPGKDDSLSRMRWYWECSHYRKELGDLILDRIFDHRAEGRTVPEDFGVLLTPANIEDNLARIREEQARYRTSHPEDVAEIEAMAQAAGISP